MCGIVAIFQIKQQTQELRTKALKMSQKLRHRGPDWSGIYVGGSAILAHERLSIVDPQSGGHPLYSPDKKQVLAVNGEIYNHRDIRARYNGKYNFQTGSDCEVIYYIETYDVTTVRASTPMYLLARVIKSMGIKMVLNGEGADEVFGGYLYFHKAPDAKAFHEETVRKLGKLYLYDCLRANKSLSAWKAHG